MKKKLSGSEYVALLLSTSAVIAWQEGFGGMLLAGGVLLLYALFWLAVGIAALLIVLGIIRKLWS